MHRRDRRHYRDVGPHQLGQRGDLSGMVHADLEDGKFDIRRTARKRQWYAPMIVVGRSRGMRFAFSRQRKPQRFFCSGLADRSGDGDHFALKPRARRTREPAQTVEHVVNDEPWRIACKLRPLVARDDHKASAGLQRRIDKIVPITVVALDREEGFAGRNRARVDGDAGHARRQAADFGRTHRRGHGIDSPERSHSAPKAARTASWSENGNIRSPTIWPVSWPLPAISSTSPSFRRLTAVRIASPRSPISSAPRAAARIPRRIAAGFSLRGLSSVTITWSAFSTAILPMIGRLPASRPPPQPKTTVSRPRV